MKDQLDRIEASQQRIEAMLVELLGALADDQDDDAEDAFSLDGDLIPSERDGLEPL